MRTDRIGDVILSTPVLTALKGHYPDSHISMMVQRYTRDLVEGHPHVDKVICFEDIADRSFLSRVRFIRQQHFDHVFLLHPRLHLSLLMFVARIPVRIGSGYRWYSFLFNRRIFEHRKTAQHHELDYNLRMLQAIDIQVPKSVEFFFHIPKSAWDHVELLLQHH